VIDNASERANSLWRMHKLEHLFGNSFFGYVTAGRVEGCGLSVHEARHSIPLRREYGFRLEICRGLPVQPSEDVNGYIRPDCVQAGHVRYSAVPNIGGYSRWVMHLIGAS
jgi:hypothetical protein